MNKTMRKSRRPVRRRRNGKDNRPWNDTINTWAMPIRAAMVIVMSVISFVAYAITRNSCDALWEEIAKQESTQTALMDELLRQKTKWNEMKTPVRLENKLLCNGIAMDCPLSGQKIAMAGRISTGEAPQATAYASNR